MTQLVAFNPKAKPQRHVAIPADADWKALAQLGFKRGELLDCFFVKTTLPSGWTIQRHPQEYEVGAIAYLYDHRGIGRISIRYPTTSGGEGNIFIAMHRFFHEHCVQEDGTVITSIFDAARNNKLVQQLMVGNFSRSINISQVGFLRVKTFADYGPKWLGLRQGIRVVQANRSNYEPISKKDFLKCSKKIGPKAQEALLDFVKTDARLMAEFWISKNIQGDPWGEQNDFPLWSHEPIQLTIR